MDSPTIALADNPMIAPTDNPTIAPTDDPNHSDGALDVGFELDETIDATVHVLAVVVTADRGGCRVQLRRRPTRTCR